jgi:hypothetical protein
MGSLAGPLLSWAGELRRSPVSGVQELPGALAKQLILTHGGASFLRSMREIRTAGDRIHPVHASTALTQP